MTDKEYRKFVKQDKSFSGKHIFFLKCSSSTNSRRILLWLRLMGLIETWDSIRHRKIYD